MLEDGAKGEKLVTRHILRKVTENEALLLDVRNEAGEVKKVLSCLRCDLLALRADLPGIIASTVSAILRAELARRKA